MKFVPLLACLSAALALVAVPTHAQDMGWQNSYQLEALGRYSDAMAALEPIAASGPEGEFKTLRRGWLFYLAGSYNESIREYRLATERNSRSLDARLGLTLPLLAEKRWRDAELAARAALELAPNNYFGLLRLAIAQEGQRDWTNMVKTTSILVATYPSDASAYVYHARANAGLGKRDDALAAYSSVLVRLPGHLEAKAFIEKK